MPPRPDLPVRAPQSRNRPDQVRKAGALCDKLTPGNNNRQEEDMEKENMAGQGASEGEAGMEERTAALLTCVLSTKQRTLHLLLYE